MMRIPIAIAEKIERKHCREMVHRFGRPASDSKADESEDEFSLVVINLAGRGVRDRVLAKCR